MSTMVLAREVDIGQVLEDAGIVDGDVAVRHLDVAPVFERAP